MNARSPNNGFRPARRDQLRQERVHDSYKLRGKLPEPAVCSQCGAVYHAGRWQWGKRPTGAQEVACAACQRIADHYPAGFVHVGGDFFAARRDEIIRLLRHHEEKQKAHHPLARIMAIEDEAGGVVLTTTDLHLAHDLGEALYHAYQGDLDFHYNEGETLLRVHWRH
ncbi:MAG TPA: BCAM0308 family protein [Rhodocyclaceae bacterium]